MLGLQVHQLVKLSGRTSDKQKITAVVMQRFLMIASPTDSQAVVKAGSTLDVRCATTMFLSALSMRKHTVAVTITLSDEAEPSRTESCRSQ